MVIMYIFNIISDYFYANLPIFWLISTFAMMYEWAIFSIKKLIRPIHFIIIFILFSVFTYIYFFPSFLFFIFFVPVATINGILIYYLSKCIKKERIKLKI